MKRFQIIIFAVLLFTPLSVLGDEIDRRAAQFFDSVMSPYCPGRTLSACPSDDARVLRDEIRAKIANGIPEAELTMELKSRFGDLSGGPSEGAMNRLAYAGVMVFLFGGMLVLAISIKGKKNVKEAD